ncbi:unnamed protein product [Echinostoma caproni]|uniref:CwfJ_C_1 domain-containing protein n=1 Tax=Echinostoma caproni TaxID=27848 RepID=A0A183BCC0_9TREM|nr:unnamed protein product [Echinostoma caproni]
MPYRCLVFQSMVNRRLRFCIPYENSQYHTRSNYGPFYNEYCAVMCLPREQAACWFCLGNPQVKKHLVVSVNTQAYLALPRGPLVEDHILVLTVGHHRSWTSCPDYVRVEIEDYKSRLKKMFADQGKAMIAFERNLKTQHYQLQVSFQILSDLFSLLYDISLIRSICHPGVPYFYVELPTGERLFGAIKKDRINSCDIQFGRYVLSDPRILNCPDKADWRNCTDELEMETKLTAMMRDKFAPYDID